MPFTLQTLTKKIETMSNTVNRNLVNEFYSYMIKRDLSKNHKINNLKVIMSYADYLGPEITFHNINSKDQILSFLDTKKKEAEKDLERKWITTWNYYLNRLKLFFRWPYNQDRINSDELDMSDWKTPEFVQIKLKRTKRVSPYSESELWDKEDILLITMGNDLKQKILVYNGIVPPPEIESKPSVISCPKCNLVNAVENKYCSACSYPLVPSAFEEIKLEEELKLQKLEEKHDDEMKKMDQKLNKIMSLVQQNPKLINVKPESLKKKL